MASENVTPENLTAQLNQQGNSSLHMNITDAAGDVGDIVGSQLLGGAELIGLGWLLFGGLILWKANARVDAAAAVMIPSVMFLSEHGYMPFAGGVIDGMLIGVAATFAIGLARLFFR